MTRFVANMEWALEDLPGVHDLLEYETRLNLFLPQHRDPVICCYDLSQFDALTSCAIPHQWPARSCRHVFVLRVETLRRNWRWRRR